MAHDPIADRFARVQGSIAASFHETKRQYDQSQVGKLHKDISLWLKFWHGLTATLRFLYDWTLGPIMRVYWRILKWMLRKYRSLWLSITYKKDQYGTPQFSKIRGAATILGTIVFLYVSYGMLMMAGTLPWYLMTVKHNEVLYLSNHSAVEGHGGSHVKLNEVYEITGCESIDCSDQDTVSFRVEASWFNEAWSILHNRALYYPDFVAAAVSPVVNRCTITSYGIRRKFLVRNFELHPDILQVRCVPVGLEKENSVHNRDYR